MDAYNKLVDFIKKSNKITVFTGAGISCASGIPDFRSENGIYNQKYDSLYRPEEIISHTFFLKHTKEFYDFYCNKMIFPNAKPNKAHLFFARLQDIPGKEVSVVTQNIDGLHQKGGSKIVYELHGSVERNYCTSCNRFYSLDAILKAESVPKCTVCGEVVKPDVVLYEEPLDEGVWKKAVKAISDSDCMIIVGTSLTVYPAASFVRYYNGNKLVLINKQRTDYDSVADLVINEDVVSVVEQVEKMLF